ncbi:MAG: stage II sporulation protein M [Candidatus Accumulibacter sp.]|nr:stage II sporulation protein M [Accumulibacter sp.]
MKESQFVRLRQSDWVAWDLWLGEANARREKRGGAPAMTPEELPSAYRRLCHDLSLARDRRYSSALIDTLQQRVLAAHQRVYGARRRLRGHWLEFLAVGLPRLARREWRFVLASAALFFVPLLLTIWLLQLYPGGVYYLLPPEHVAEYEFMYSPEARRLGRPPSREAAGQVRMLAHYISHNVQIDFQCFAGGIAFGLGSLFFLVFNGLIIGAVAGHLTQLGLIETFWGFVVGHSAPELIGIVLSGAAGLRIGHALIAPGRRRRADALKEAAPDAVRLLYGAAALTFGAAFIEALWSANRALPFNLKIGAGIALWCALLAYFLLAGRRAHAA